MRVRCCYCTKTFDDLVDDGRLLEGSCKRCVANGKKEAPLVAILTLDQMLASDPEFKRKWEEEGLIGVVFITR